MCLADANSHFRTPLELSDAHRGANVLEVPLAGLAIVVSPALIHSENDVEGQLQDNAFSHDREN
jgi:hypothetical protein